jgi:ligand-binding SRPBCC domain-containing protein
MKIHRLQYETALPLTLSEAWDFFSNPANLGRITPKEMDFRIVSGSGQRTYAGQLIIYKLRPLMGIPLQWVTEITQCAEGKYFIDEQRSGPYRFWHHEHRFSETADGVLMTDILHYALPFGILGELMGGLFLHNKVRQIFTYREQVLREHFPAQRIQHA